MPILTGSELNAANSHVLIVKKEFTDSVGDPSRILKESTSPGLACIAIQNLVREACDDVLNDLLWGLTALVLIGDDHRVCLCKAHCLRLTQLYICLAVCDLSFNHVHAKKLIIDLPESASSARFTIQTLSCLLQPCC